MKLKSKILLGFGVFLIILTTLLIQKQSKKETSIREGIVIKREFTEPVDTTMLVDEDSIFHSKICSNYGVAWKSYDLKKKKNKIVLFDSYSGKLLVYYLEKNKDISKIDVNPADKIYGWNFFEVPKDNKLKGEIIYVEKDTTFYWIIDEKINSLIDENGMVFNKMEIPINKRE